MSAACRGAGLTDASLRYHRSCCASVVRYCADHGIEDYDGQARDEFLAEQDARLRRGDIGPVFRSSLEKTANMLLEFKLAGKVEWRRRRPTLTSLPVRFETALCLFEESVSGTLAGGSVKLVVGETRRLLTHLRDCGHDSLPGLELDDVRGFLVAVAPKHRSSMGTRCGRSSDSSASSTALGCPGCGRTRCCHRSRRDGCGCCRASPRTRWAGCSQ